MRARVPEVGTQHAYRWINFSTGAAPGWYVLYAIVVRTGANPLAPREWAGWRPASFHPSWSPRDYSPLSLRSS
jgi:hypothetical protein